MIPESLPNISEEKTAPAVTSGWAPRILQWILLILVSLILLLTAIWWLAGSRSVRGWVTDYLAAHTGVEWQIARTRLQWPCDFICYDVEMRPIQGGGKGAVKIGSLRIGWRGIRMRTVFIDMPEVTLVDDGILWQPAFLHDIGRLREIREVYGLITNTAPSMVVEIAGGILRMTDRQGTVVAEMAGVDFYAQPITLPGRELYYFRVDARMVKRSGGALGQDVHREWMSTAANGYIELSYHGTWKGDEKRRDIWSRAVPLPSTPEIRKGTP